MPSPDEDRPLVPSSDPTSSDGHKPSDPESSTSDPAETYVTLTFRSSDLDDAPFWREVEAFNQMPASMTDAYYGQYVAVYNGNIVDADRDEGELALRFYRTFGYVPVYIHKVGTEEGLIDAEEEMAGRE